MTIFRFDLETKNFYEITTRSGGSNKLKWTTLIRQVYLKDVQFGVCQHPFDPEKTSFRRKPFSLYTDKDYGIAIKGTELSQVDYDNVVSSSKGKVNSLVNKLFWRYGATFWQSYPSLTKTHLQNCAAGHYSKVLQYLRCPPSNCPTHHSGKQQHMRC